MKHRLGAPVDLEPIAELDVSAASGLVAIAERLYVVADDEHFLATYDFAGRPLGRLALWPDALPDEHAERKRLKSDLEALTQLPDGRLLALGSGSTPRRRRGALIDPTSNAVQHIDLGPLYDVIATRVADLNIEGAAVLGDRLWLAHRGNGASRQNACIEVGLAGLEALLTGARTFDPCTVCAVHAIDLGELDGVPLGLTDLSPLPGRGLMFSAAAEASPDTYQDGPCTGSVVGLLDTHARLVQLRSVNAPCKLEGIAAVRTERTSFELYLVADPDDRARRAPLFRALEAGALLA